jgi:hypothetical protein
VFEAALVHEESVEDAGVGEILDNDAADGGVAAGYGWGLVFATIKTASFTAKHLVEGVGGFVGVEVVEGLVLEALGAEETPGEGDGAVGEHCLHVTFGIQFGEHLVAVGLEFARVLALNDGLLGEEAVLDGVMGDDGLAFGGAGAGGFLGVATVGVDLGLGGHGMSSVSRVASCILRIEYSVSSV